MNASRLIVVGASGQIGSALMAAARAAGRTAIGTARKRVGGGLIGFDIRTETLRSVVPTLGPGDVVYLMAAHIHPTWIFANQDEARDLNLDASRRLADETMAAGARFVFMSTDLVFDGKTGAYAETAVPKPLNLYGRLKVAMEQHILGRGNAGIVARCGWNIAWQKDTHCAVAQCYENLLKPDARMADDNVISISDVDDTARGLLALAGPAPPAHDVYHLVSTPGVARSDLAAVIKATSRFGDRMGYRIVPFSEIDYTEPRPARAYLRSERLEELGVRFKPPIEVVQRKVALMDQWRSV